MSLALLDRAAGATMCEILTIAGGSLINMGIYATGTGIGAKPGVAAMGLGAASLLAKNYLCEPIPVDSTWVPDVDGCREVDGHGTAQIWDGVGRWFNPWENNTGEARDKSFVATKITANYVQKNDIGWDQITIFDTKLGPLEYWGFWNATEDAPPPNKCRILVTEGVCGQEGPGGEPPPPELYDPIEYYDEETNCTYNVTFQGFFEETPGGYVKPVLLIEAAGETRTGGGVIGGCNFNPTIYVPNPGGGGTQIPGPPGPPGPPGFPGDGNIPWWWAPLLSGSVGAALNLIGQGLTAMFPPTLPEGSFTLQAPCDQDENGNYLKRVWTYPEQSWAERSMAHEITMLEALQMHLNWKTPICGNEKPPLEGQWVTTRWESVEKMAHSGRRLRKLFRYRTKSTRDVGQLSAYWEAFTWQAGEVCVYHKGAWWGTPQVWAASQEEGQRVIRFAAAEAGIDPDQDGEWGTSSSRSPRYGMSGTMKVALFEGFPWVASRDGAEWPNVLAKTSAP